MIIVLGMLGAAAALVALGLRNERGFTESWRALAAGRVGQLDRRLRHRMISAIK